MAEPAPGGRAYFDYQQRRRRELQERLTGRRPADGPPGDQPPATGPPADGPPSAEPPAAGPPLAEPPAPEPPSPEPPDADPSDANPPGDDTVNEGTADDDTADDDTVDEGTADGVPLVPGEVPAPEPPAEPEHAAVPQPGRPLADTSQPPADTSQPPADASRPVAEASQPAAEAVAAPAPPPPLRLVVVNGSNAGEEYGLAGKELLIGREDGSDIKIDDLTVSHSHALLRIRGDKVTIEDLRSLNGTKLNGKVVSKAVAISSGDVIAVGAVKLLIEEPAEGRP